MINIAFSPGYDITLRQALRKGGRQFMSELGFTSERLLDTDVSTVNKRNVDYLALGKKSGIIHVEFQRAADPRMAIRMLDYYGSILRAHSGFEPTEIPKIDQVVIQLDNGVRSGTVREFYDKASIEYRNKASRDIPARSLIDNGDSETW